MKQYRYLTLLIVLSTTFRLATDATTAKLTTIGPFTFVAPLVFFPLTYLISDLLTEVYGYAQARRAIWYVFIASVLAGVLYQVVLLLPETAGFNNQESFIRVFGIIPRILIAGWLSVLTGSFLNDLVLAKMKIWTNGKYLWTRTISSTVVAELGDTLIFYPLAFYGSLPNGVILSAMISGWTVKVSIEVLLTPLTYWVVQKLKKIESEDYFDRDTDFNPFTLKT